MFRKFLSDESGQGMVEYVLIVVLVAVAVIIAVRVFGDKIKELFEDSTGKIEKETGDAVK